MVELLSCVYQNKTLGTPIAMLVRNQDARSQDYLNLPPRTGHADQVWLEKFHHVDPRGGGRSSGRETLSRVLGGALAQMLLAQLSPKTRVVGFARKIGPNEIAELDTSALFPEDIDQFPARFPDPTKKETMALELAKLKQQGDSWGGVAEIHIHPS